jgi:PhoH-like ATPase
MVKTFVLDTNVLIHDNDAVFQFADNRVVLPLSVLEELDNLKGRRDEKGYNARVITRKLDSIFMEQTDLQHEVKIGEGTLRIEFNHTDSLPAGLELGKKDNLILQTALFLKNKGEKVIFVSKDLNARIKACALGLEVNDYEKEKVEFESLHPGWSEMTVAPSLIDRFYAEKELPFDCLEQREWIENTYLILKAAGDESKSALARIWPRLKTVKPTAYDGGDIWGVRGLNAQQRFALDLLLDDRVPLVALVGSAGTGKTLMAVAAALKKTLDDKKYKKTLVARPIMPLGKDIGYLPGSKEEKLSAWMEPIFDNIYFLLAHNAEEGGQDMRQMKEELNYLLDSNLLELGALTYIRGRSIPHQFVVIDEAQNLTPHEIKTVVSRVGEGSKIVLTGDAEQIDNPYLDSDSNGLSYLIEKFKGQEIFGAVNLVKSERSPLASLAAKLL